MNQFGGLVRSKYKGLGSAIGATALVARLIQLLSQFEFIPIFGTFTHEVIEKLDRS